MRGKKGERHSRAEDPPRRRANKQPGHGTFANDRPPIFQVVSRDTGEVRFWGELLKDGRSLRFGPQYEETQELRKRQQSDAFKQKYAAHRGGVEAYLSALIRGQGLRTTRHIGCRNNHLHALCAGAAVNLARCAAFRAGYRPQKRPARLGLLVEGGASAAPAAVLAA